MKCQNCKKDLGIFGGQDKIVKCAKEGCKEIGCVFCPKIKECTECGELFCYKHRNHLLHSGQPVAQVQVTQGDYIAIEITKECGINEAITQMELLKEKGFRPIAYTSTYILLEKE